LLLLVFSRPICTRLIGALPSESASYGAPGETEAPA
jgi:hypothetical protein